MSKHQQRWNQRVPDFEQFEHELHTHVPAVEHKILATELAHYDIQAEQVQAHAMVYGQPMRSTETYLTTAGPVTLERQLYRPAGRGSRHI